MASVQEVAIAAIAIPRRLRRVNEAWAAVLAENIGQGGLTHPIQVAADGDGAFKLIAGAHRLAAAGILGWRTIAASIIEGSPLELRLKEIDENLFRHELSPFDRAKFLAERQEIWEELHPETRRGVAGGKARQRNGEPANEMFSFAADAAARIGLSQRAVQLAVKLWRDLTPEARELIEGTAIAGNGALLGRIASLPAEEQAGTVRAALVGEKGVRPEADPVLAQYEKLVRAWARSGEKARQRFRRFLAEEVAQ